MLDIPERTDSDPATDARFILEQMAGLAGLIDQIRTHRHLDPEQLGALRELEQSYELLQERLGHASR